MTAARARCAILTVNFEGTVLPNGKTATGVRVRINDRA